MVTACQVGVSNLAATGSPCVVASSQVQNRNSMPPAEEQDIYGVGEEAFTRRQPATAAPHIGTL